MATEEGVITKSVTDERRRKTQEKIRWLGKQVGLTDEFMESLDQVAIAGDRPGVDVIHYKTTESVVGFLVYVSQTYTMMVSYLKGVYLTLNLWRKGQDKNGWMTKKARTEAQRGILQNDGPPLSGPRSCQDSRQMWKR